MPSQYVIERRRIQGLIGGEDAVFSRRLEYSEPFLPVLTEHDASLFVISTSARKNLVRSGDLSLAVEMTDPKKLLKNDCFMWL